MELNARLGKYELQELLGGGMSHVFRARDTVLGRTVAVKILTDAACAQPEAKARFLAEARLASNLAHDNVLSIYDFGEDETGHPYMVMEFLRGYDLRSAIRKGELPDLHSKLRVALQTARALEYIHAQKVIHRDIKPENVYLTSNAVVKLMDFGIAKTEGVSMTRTGFVLGTPSYMAPEQVRGLELTPQVDVYAFGALLFELFTGTKPISGDTVERIFYVILNEPLDLSPLAAVNTPEVLHQLVVRCTAKDPAARPQGFTPICGVLEQALGGPNAIAAAASQSGTAAVIATPSVAPAAATPVPQAAISATPTPTAVPAGPGPKPARRVAKWIGAAAGMLLAVAAGVIWSGYHELDVKIRASAEAISAVGFGADGLIKLDTVHQFENLRADLDFVDSYHRNGGPIGYRMGAAIFGDLYEPARRLYFERFHTFFLGPAQNNLLQFLRGLPGAQGASYGSVHKTLKAYLMTTSQPGKADAKFLVPVLFHWWALGLNPGAEREAAARRQFEFYAGEAGKDDPYPLDMDSEAAARARRYLGQFGEADRAYAALLEDATGHASELSFNARFPGSEQVLAEPFEVPGEFTKAGWEYVQAVAAHPERYVAADSWVLDGNAPAGDRTRLAEELNSRYRADFVRAWRQYLQSAALARFTDAREAARKLKLLAGAESPLGEWLSLAAQNTGVDASAAAIFQPVVAAQVAGQRYREMLAPLSVAVEGASSGNAGSTGEYAAQALAGVKKIEATFRADPEGHVDTVVSRMLEQPIVEARAAVAAR
jgi:hypothetical protein